MKRSAAAFAAIFLVATAALAAPQPQLAGPKTPAPHGTTPAASTADLLFQQGEFEQARAAYQAVPKGTPQYEAAQRQLGALALYQNRLGEAEVLLNKAHALNPSDLDCLGLLAETMHRQGRFAEMAQLLRQIGRPEREAEFQLFGKATPYRIVAQHGPVSVDLQFSDPLPVVQAKVNGLDALFLIDTGAPEMILDPEFAVYAHLQTSGGQQKTAAPGARPMINFARIGQFTLQGLETDDVPAMLLSTRGLSMYARNKRIAGVIGTEFLSHFRPTIDYVHDKLILEPRDAAPRTAGSIAEVPFWFVGDHFLLAQGRVDQGPKQLFLVDTGVAGMTFSAPASTLQDAGIQIPTPQGPAKNPIGVQPNAKFPIKKLSLGNLTQANLSGTYGTFPPALEAGLGVHIGGIVSHKYFVPYSVTFDFVRMTIGFRK
ncbi:MAG TPA: aspartyl protease family protein [Rhizomicrobium sp.]|jgi:hypothetical protein|nr:aspartyl protease family protein [Rhizomicrobium sp.]